MGCTATLALAAWRRLRGTASSRVDGTVPTRWHRGANLSIA